MNWELIFTLVVGASVPLGCFAFFYLKARETERRADKILRSFGL